MLSDGLSVLIGIVEAGASPPTKELGLMLRMYKLEARNMEERLEMLLGRPHAPLDQTVLKTPAAEGLAS